MNYLIKRFLRGGIAGATTSMLIIMGSNVSNWGDLGLWLNSLAVAFVFGFVTGFILAIDKWIRTTANEFENDIFEEIKEKKGLK